MSQEKTRIKLQDLSFYGDKSSSKYHDSKHIIWDRSGGSGPVVFFTDSCLHLAKLPMYKDSFKVAWILEPFEINPYPYKVCKDFGNYFNMILSHHLEYLKVVKNGEWYPSGMSWIDEKDWQQSVEKTKSISLIASNKNTTSGHKLRHLIANSDLNIDLYGRGYNPIDHKIEALKDYCFSVSIENTRARGYFSEKILDCFATHTVPIYWGCPNIEEYFNPNGIIVVDNPTDITHWCNELYDNELFDKYYSLPVMDAMNENFEKAKQYMVAEDWIYNNILVPKKLV